MTEQRDSVVVVECDDYVAFYVNGRNVWSAHSINKEAVLRALNIDYTHYFIEDQADAENYDWRAATFNPHDLPDNTRWD